MPEWDYDDEDDNQSSDLVKQLRSQLKDFKKRNTELDTELSTLRPQVRKASVSSVLSELGYNTKIAALLPDSVDPSKEAVETWLKDYGDLFNLQPVKAAEEVPAEVVAEVPLLAGQSSQVVDQATRDQWARAQSGQAAVGTTTPDIEAQQIAQLGRAMDASKGSYDNFLAILKGDQPLPS